MSSKFACRDCCKVALCLVRVPVLKDLNHLGWVEAVCVRCGRGWVMYQNTLFNESLPQGKHHDDMSGCPTCLRVSHMGRVEFTWRCYFGACFEISACPTSHGEGKWAATSALYASRR